jgi:hypothetical protein
MLLKELILYFFLVGYLMMLLMLRLYKVGWLADSQIRKDLEGNSHGLIKVLSWHLPGKTEENHKKTSV